jgi:hypothetical protein
MGNWPKEREAAPVVAFPFGESCLSKANPALPRHRQFVAALHLPTLIQIR